jgi:hypothetical protein
MIKSRRMRWAWYLAQMVEKRNAYRILVRKPKRKRPLGRPRLRWVYNIKVWMKWTELMWLMIGTSGGLL